MLKARSKPPIVAPSLSGHGLHCHGCMHIGYPLCTGKHDSLIHASLENDSHWYWGWIVNDHSHMHCNWP